ncbi:MAG: hypothetical protein RIC24_17705 [Hyphomicrobiales bacterium]
MGGEGGRDGGGKDIAFPTKRKFRKLWSEINDASDEHWLLDLRGCANLIGLCVYPVGWNWAEYQPENQAKIYPWEKKAQKANHFETALNGPPSMEGSVALKSGAVSRQNHIERLLMRMIKRKEVIVTVYDHRMQGYEIDGKLRLNATLKLSVESSVIGLNELTNGDAWDCRIDTKSLLSTLDNIKGWETKAGPYDWLKIERHARDLFEIQGVPRTKGMYVDKVCKWHGNLFKEEQVEPARSTVSDLIADLHSEYSN